MNEPFTREQERMIETLWHRFGEGCNEPFSDFRHRFRWYYGDYIGRNIAGMFIGIEKNGYAHT